ncbi:C25 family cysteine peptidase [Flavobacteriales bacterium]|nr:C25 family cysteine peptidase [Flavobacteriales bacterium]
MNFLRKIIFFFLYVLILLNFYSQSLGNEWINFNQKYFHFPISNSGIHRIEFTTLNSYLNNYGIDISTIQHDNFQLFGKEKEVSILVKDYDNNGFLNQQDYIEFYAEKNNGWLDTLVYDSASYIPDKYYSLFNDTIRYYFTWNNSINNKRTVVETDTNFSSYNIVNYCWKNEILKFNSKYLFGKQQSGISSPKYDDGEGWAGPSLTKNASNTEQINSLNSYNNGPSSFGEVNIISANSSTSNSSSNNHNTKLYINNNLLFDTSYSSYKTLHLKYNFNSINLSPLTEFKHEISDIGQGTDYQNIASINLFYPHNFDFSTYDKTHFGIPSISNQKQRITISNSVNSTGNDLLYILDDINRIIPIVTNNNVLEAVIPTGLNDSIICYLTTDSNIQYVNEISSVNSQGYFTNFSIQQLDSAFIIVTHKELLSSARTYASYRAQNMDTLVVDIEELYHQFSAGIYKNPLSIKRFLKFTMQNWPTWPSHLFLIGKSVRFNDETTPGSRSDSTSYRLNAVPSWGYPSSDNHLAVGLEPNKRGFSIPIGRLSAVGNSSVLTYLNKVIELESYQGTNSTYNLENKGWQKNIAHFSGGSDSSEQAYMNNKLLEFQQIIEDTLFGGQVKKFGKNPFTSVIDPLEFQIVQDYLEEGVSLITFFGHASSGYGFSQNIDQPDNWNNQGKYPIVVGLGCYSGDVHNTDTNSFAEQILRPQSSGAIGFISTVKQGFIPYINQYAKYLYKMIGNYGYNKSIGQQMVMTIDSLDLNTSTLSWEPKFESNYNGMTLQGDPAVKVNSHSLPELVINEQRIWTEPRIVDLSKTSFELKFELYNLGKSIKDSIYVEVRQNLPNGSDTIYSKFVHGGLNKDTVTFNIVNNSENSVGQNIFNISVDLPISNIQEAEDETANNSAEYILNISSNSIIPVWPYDLSIVGNPSDTLRVSTINPLEPLNTYYFEIDTTVYFNSSFLKTQSVLSTGGVIEASPNNWLNASNGSSDSLIFSDSAVYYWRTRPDSTVIDWKTRSFQYLKNKWGWSQAHFDQFRDNEFLNINYDTVNKQFNFLPTFKSITCKNYIQHVALGSEWSGTYWEVSGDIADYGGWIKPAIMIGVVDPNSLNYWKTPFIDNSTTPPTILNPNNCFGQYNGDPGICGNTSLLGRPREQGYFMFRYDVPTQLDSLASFLDSKIPNGHYIIAYSYIPNSYGNSLLYNSPLYANWSNDLFTSFQNLGATGFTNSNQPDDGFIFFCEKGDPSTAIEVRSDSIAPGFVPSQLLELSTSISSSLENGKMTSSVIGPSLNWGNIYWEQNALESLSADSSRLRVLGLSSLTSNQKIIIIDTLFSNIDSIINLENIDSNFNFLQLELETFDDSLLTPAQISRWQITYDPLPELALNPKKRWYLDSSIVQQGDSIYFAVAIENISPFNMDSILVKYKLENQSGIINIPYSKRDSLKARAVLIDTMAIPSRNLIDDYYMWITANPIIGSKTDQPEQFYFNNLAQTKISVVKDNTNPLLDVTFDGVHILNNDIVSPNPFIIIELDDENPFLVLNDDVDTANFQLEIMNPNSSNWKRINFYNNNNPNLDWYVKEDENKFIIEFKPSFREDGIYKLRVQGQDKSGNLSGDEPYQIQFEVIQKSTISNIYNYPNPFSTKTHFAFTLTGSEIPERLDIQILNIRGRLIKQIALHEIEILKIGNNVTEYYWDGTDDFGDPVGNGVYLYRVISEIDKESIEHRETTGDKAFTNGIGKMYLIR